jgi:hypothetical protein
MAYRWTSNTAQTVTTDPGIHVSPQRRPQATVVAVIEQFLAAAGIGAAVNRSGRPYRSSTLRDIRGILEHHVAPPLGDMRLRGVLRSDIQLLVDRLAAEHLSESRIRSVISALRALYGYAIDGGYVDFNPAEGLTMTQTDARSSGQRAPMMEPEHVTTPPRLDAGPRPSSDAPSVKGGGPPPPRRPREPREPHRDAVRAGPAVPDRALSHALRAALVLFVLVVLVALLAPI